MRVTVFGSARVLPESREYADALRLGRLLAARGDVVVTGGYGGIMEAVSRGAHEGGGVVVGVTVSPWQGRLAANEYVSEERIAATLFERLEALIESDALLALPGGAGTLGEVALAWNMRQMDLMPSKPVILVGPEWRAMSVHFLDHLIIQERDIRLLTLVDTIDDALGCLETASVDAAQWFG